MSLDPIQKELAVIWNYFIFDRCGANRLRCRQCNTQYSLEESGAAKLEQGEDTMYIRDLLCSVGRLVDHNGMEVV